MNLTNHPPASLDWSARRHHGDPLRRCLDVPVDGSRVPAGVTADGQQHWFLPGEWVELLLGPACEGTTAGCAEIVGQLIGQVKQLRADNTALRAENSVLHNEIQSLDLQLQQAREGRDGGTA